LLNLNNNEIIIAFVRVANATRCIPSNEEEENKKKKEKKGKNPKKSAFERFLQPAVSLLCASFMRQFGTARLHSPRTRFNNRSTFQQGKQMLFSNSNRINDLLNHYKGDIKIDQIRKRRKLCKKIRVHSHTDDVHVRRHRFMRMF